MISAPLKNCHVCGKSNWKKVQGKLRDKPEIGIIKCSSCGLVTLETTNHISEQLYQDSKMRPGAKNEEWVSILKHCLRDDQRRVKQFRPLIENKSVLDFGCGSGGFLLKAEDVAKDVCGIELDEYFVNKLRSEGKIKIFNSVSDIDTKFDCITLFQVLEHLTTPKDILLRLKDKLKSDGKLIIEVPNSNDALLSMYGSEAFSNFTYWSCHVFLYNSLNLRMLAESLGFKVHYVSQYQRYPISNHLYWLAKGEPGGHEIWDQLDSEHLNMEYRAMLSENDACDTLVMSLGL